ncbi:MAG: penicillin-binding protein 1A [Alphaproteobacteria bacterium]|nr:penicillin-binding protein 1A [Alphaproteobacteria bacterium]
MSGAQGDEGPERGGRRWRLPRVRLRWVLTGLAGLVLVAAAGTLALGLWLAPDFPDRKTIWEAGKVPSIVFLDAAGERIATRGAIRGESVPATALPDHLIEAFLATEDRRFYSHPGVDALSLARAVLANLRAGGLVQGGSTITQQVAKNLFLTPERTLRRKLQEAALALWLERHLSKHEILTLYLNRIYFGAGTYGIEAAAETYFGVPASEVTLAQAAMLAGLPKAPSRYAPTSDLALAQARAADVLRNMVEAGFRSEMEIAQALAHPAEPRPRTDVSGSAYFLDHALSEVTERFGLEVLERDLVITTTLDQRLQSEAVEAVRTHLEAEGEAAKAGQAALVSLAPDGAIRAMVGGRSYEESQFNRATQARRQPGSAFKPFVFLAALEAGLTPDTVRTDGPLTIGGWSPGNYGGSYQGPVTLREAVAKSLNTVAVRVSEEVGRESVSATAQRMGIVSPLTAGPSLALGSSEVSVLELAGAYLPFATLGLKEAPFAVVRVATANGGVLWERAPQEPRRVIEADTARAMNQMLHQVLRTGTARSADLGARPAAAKTGTSQDWRDAWLVGYTADLVTAVWVGNDDDSPMNRVTGGGLPARIWKDYMVAAHEGRAITALEGAEDYVPPVAIVASTDEYAAFLDRLSRHFTEVRHMRTVAREPERRESDWKRVLPWNW